MWGAEIIHVPVTHDSCYLVAVMDWATRHVLAWRLSGGMVATFRVGAPTEWQYRKDDAGR